MRKFMKNIIAAAAVAVGFLGLTTMASADDIKIGYGANVTINMCNCGPSVARHVSRPAPIAVAPQIAKQQPVVTRSARPEKVAPAPAVGSAEDIRCLYSGNARQLKVRWEKPSDGGNCNGFVRASDFAKVASLAAKGYTKFMIRFEVVHCPSGLAKMPAEVKGDILTARPWDKTCLPKGQEFVTRIRP